MPLVDRSWLCSKILGTELCTNRCFWFNMHLIHDSWESENIQKIQIIWTVWPSSVIRWTRSTWKMHANCIFRAQCVHDLYYFTCAICCILHARTVHDLYLICAQYVRDLCIFLRSSRARCFVGPGFEPLTMQHDLFTGPRFNSRAWLSVSGQ